MSRGPRPAPVELTGEEREELLAWTRRRTTAQGLARRARIVLACADPGLTNTEIAEQLGVSRPTVTKWRARFLAHRTDGLLDEPRPGKPRTISDAQVFEVVTKTLETKPKHATQWSTRTMAIEVGLSPATVARIWRQFELKPHKQQRWKLSKDPLFIEKTRDIVGLYMDPPERAIVLCVDEKSQIQALDRTAPILPMLPGVPERATHDYVRHGTSSLFAALDVATGKVIGSTHQKHRAVEFKKFLIKIDDEVPDDLAIHVVLDNYATHKTPVIKKWLERHPRFVMHFTPTSASWLNLVERLFSEITTKMLRRSTHRSVKELNADIHGWIENWNENPIPYVWTKTADEILESIAQYCNEINDARH